MGQTEEIFIVKARSALERAACFAIGEEVFIKGQVVPLESERDGLYEEALPFLARYKGKPVGNARVRFKESGTIAKIERVAVVSSARGFGIGEKLMRFIEGDDQIRSRVTIVLEAQSYIIPFYERLGYKASGDAFMDAHIPHRFMSKQNRAAESQ